MNQNQCEEQDRTSMTELFSESSRLVRGNDSVRTAIPCEPSGRTR
ncbi:MAG: hypothetical protein ACLRS1_07745 [Oscillospiraceae bacterium]